MLKITTKDDVRVFKMGRSMGRYVPYYVHSFLIGDTLIDTGTAYAGKEFLSVLNHTPVARILNTHFHEDHIGNNAAIREKHQSDIYAHADSLPFLANPAKNRLRPYQRIIWKYPDAAEAKPIGGTIRISGYDFEVIHTRGHSEGHVCFYEPARKWLFTGDMFCGIKNIYLRRDEDFHLMLESLEQLSKLQIDTIFCSLKGVVESGDEALAAKIMYMKNQREKIVHLRRSGMTPAQIRNRLFGREDARFYITGGHFSKLFLVENILQPPPDLSRQPLLKPQEFL